jgi:TolB-like protein/DNA-binding winged helix-turn-helix (wHTH) protein
MVSRHLVYRFDEFLVDPEAWGLYRDGREVHLEPVVLKLLIYLITHRDHLVTSHELMDTVWGNTVVSDSALRTAIARLRDALGEKPSHPKYLETVHGKGYRFVAEVDEVETGAAEGDLAPETTGHKSRRGLYAVIAAGLMALVAYLFWPAQPAGEIRSLAVLPLDNLTGDPQQDQFVESLHEYLIMELYRIGEFSVTSRQSTMRFRDSELPLPEIARQLGVDALVEGSAIRLSDRAEIALQLIHGSTDEHLWAETYDREARHLPGLFADVASAISAEILGKPQAPRNAQSIDPLAGRAYMEAIQHLSRTTPDELELAIQKFKEAVAIEPGFALAWGNLGAAYGWQAILGFTPPETAIGKARTACLNTLTADADFYLGHVCMGWIHWINREVEKACRSFDTAMQLNPSEPYTLHGNADCMLLNGRIDESLELVHQMQMVDPFNLAHNRIYASHLFMARRYDEAVTESFRLEERFPGFSMHSLRASVYWLQGLRNEAIEQQRLGFELKKDEALLTALDEGRSSAGPVGAWRAIAEASAARFESQYVDPFRIGDLFTFAGMPDEAFYWYERAVENGSAFVTYMPVWPTLDVLRDDPRYLRLLQLAGLSDFTRG